MDTSAKQKVQEEGMVTLILLVYRGRFYVWACGLHSSVRYNAECVILRLCSIQFTVTSAGLKKVVRYIEEFVK